LGSGGARFGGIVTDEPIKDISDFINLVLLGKAKPFVRDDEGIRLL
jgi:hypothetical protein